MGKFSKILRVRSLKFEIPGMETKNPPSEEGLKYLGRESNPHVRRHWILNPARLPIPPPRLLNWMAKIGKIYKCELGEGIYFLPRIHENFFMIRHFPAYLDAYS